MKTREQAFKDLETAKVHLGFSVQPTFCGLPHFIVVIGNRSYRADDTALVSRNILEPSDTVVNRRNGRHPPKPTCLRCIAAAKKRGYV